MKWSVEVLQKLDFEEMVIYTLLVANDIIDLVPSSHKDAIKCKDSGKWQVAMEKIQSLLKNQTWDLARLRGIKIVDFTWIYK